MIESRRLYELFTGDPSEYRRFIDQIFHERVESVLTRVPFFRDYMNAKELTPSDFMTIDTVRKFPILDRRFIQSQEMASLINSSVDMAQLPPPSHTSGSSGKPLELHASRDFYIASFYIMQLSYGGSLPFVVACLSDRDYTLPVVDGCQVHFISRKSPIDRLYARLVEIKPKVVMMRPDRWRLLVDEFGADLARLRLTVAGVSSAMSTASERAYFGTFLGCPTPNMYGATELGGAIFECPFGREHVVSHNNYLEIVQDDGSDSRPGETGHLVWTSLDNTIMPFVRYKIGDVGAFAREQACNCGWNGPVVEGVRATRPKEAVVLPNGLKISFYHFNVEILKNEGSSLFRQYQLIQERTDLLRLLVVKSAFFKERGMEDMLIRLRELLLGEIALEVTYVEHIEQAGNKFQFFVPLNVKN